MTKEEFEAAFGSSLNKLIFDLISKLPNTRSVEDLRIEIILGARNLSQIVSGYIESVKSNLKTEIDNINVEVEAQKNKGGTGNTKGSNLKGGAV